MEKSIGDDRSSMCTTPLKLCEHLKLVFLMRLPVKYSVTIQYAFLIDFNIKIFVMLIVMFWKRSDKPFNIT